MWRRLNICINSFLRHLEKDKHLNSLLTSPLPFSANTKKDDFNIFSLELRRSNTQFNQASNSKFDNKKYTKFRWINSAICFMWNSLHRAEVSLHVMKVFTVYCSQLLMLPLCKDENSFILKGILVKASWFTLALRLEFGSKYVREEKEDQRFKDSRCSYNHSKIFVILISQGMMLFFSLVILSCSL